MTSLHICYWNFVILRNLSPWNQAITLSQLAPPAPPCIRCRKRPRYAELNQTLVLCWHLYLIGTWKCLYFKMYTKNTCYNENKLCTQNRYIVVGSIVNMIGRACATPLRGRQIFTLTYYNFWPLIYNFGTWNKKNSVVCSC